MGSIRPEPAVHSTNPSRVEETTITELAPRGFGVARVEGKVLFVPLTAPGDLIRFRVTDDHGRYAFADLVELLRPGGSRSASFCRVFGECGGCQLQHVSYAAQVEAKRAWVREAFRRIAKVDMVVDPVIVSPALVGYRNKATIHVGSGVAGFLQAQSRRIVSATSCPMLETPLREILEAIGEWAAAAPPDQSFRVVLRRGTEGDPLVVVHDCNRPGALEALARTLPEARVVRPGSRAAVTFRCQGVRFEAQAETFFQINAHQFDGMISVLSDLLPSGGVLVDGHAGVGWPSLCLASRFRRVVCVEIAVRACQFGSANAQRAGFGHVSFCRGSLASAERRGELPRDPDAALVDPPRAGLLPHDLTALANTRVPVIVYVSCDPATQARDVARLGAYGYEVVRVIPFDLFPHTAHVESIALLNLRR